MLLDDIYFKYRLFLREKIQNKYLNKYKDSCVVGENLINGYYFALFETTIKEKTCRFIIVENFDKPVFSQIQPLKNKDGYITMSKRHLDSILPKSCKAILAKRGYATSVEIGMKKDNRFCWHRLVACLYYNCIGLQVHHMEKDCKTKNDINNLVPLKENYHKIIDKDNRNGINLARNEQLFMKNKHFNKRNTLAKNDEIILKILKLKASGKRTTEIISIVKKQIRQSSVYKILKDFYYCDEFLNWFELCSAKDSSELYGILEFSWIEIMCFEFEHIRR